MPKEASSSRSAGTTGAAGDRKALIGLLNEDLAREYQAIIAYVVYSQVLKGAAYMSIAKELETHAKQELDHALIIAKQIDYLGGTPAVAPKPVKLSDKRKPYCASTWRTRPKRSDSIARGCGSARHWANMRWRSTSARSSRRSRITRSIWRRRWGRTHPI